MTTYNHMCTIAFTVISTNDGEHLTADELRNGIRDRMQALKHDDDEVLEACLPPQDTYIEEPFIEQSVSEGWDLFNVDGRLMLQRCDEAEIFITDLDALLFVADKALRGSLYHRKALEKIGSLA